METEHTIAESARAIIWHLTNEKHAARRALLIADYVYRASAMTNAARQKFDPQFLAASAPPEARDFVLPEARGGTAVRQKVDVAILCVVPQEWRMTMLAFDVDAGSTPVFQGVDRYWQTSVLARRCGRRVTVLIAMVGEARNVPCAAAVGRLLLPYDPGCVVLLGICGGIKAKTKLGDVIVPETVWNTDGGKRIVGRVLPRPVVCSVSSRMVADIRYYQPTSMFSDRLRRSAHALGARQIPSRLLDQAWTPVLHSGSLLVTEQVVVDDLHSDFRKHHDDRARGVDMESYGFAFFCKQLVPAIKWGIFRGVSDFGMPIDSSNPEEKGDADHDSYQNAAALAAAHMLRDFLEQEYYDATDNPF